MDFLAENNICGQTILNLVSWGNAIIAELLRLSDFIPAVFTNEVRQKHDLAKYVELLSDFSYFKCSDYFENVIISKPSLEELDEEFKDNYIQILTRFYQAFQSTHQYITDLNRFVDDLEGGVFIQQNLESVLHNEDGRQLMCEAVYLYGVMLLVLDMKIEGPVREKILVSYYRYSASKSSLESNIDEVCKMLRDTGFSKSNGFKRPTDYPESFFSRIPLNKKLVIMVLSRLRSDDIYNQLAAYSAPEHRSAALSTQAAMLYVVLYFSPDILHGQQATMREIVDKFFPDNWVISIYMGMVVNLGEAWSPYKAAYQALGNTLDFSNVKNMAVFYGKQAIEHLSCIETTLKQGVLTDEHVTNNVNNLTNAVRSSNVTIRWLMLHTISDNYNDSYKKCRQIREQVIQDCCCEQKNILQLLLLTADFELKLKEIIRKLLEDKKKLWEGNKKEGTERMNELSAVFSGTTVLSRIEKNENLKSWFGEIGKQIEILDYEDSTAAGRKIIHLIQALEEVQEFHQLDSYLQVKQFLEDTRNFLYQMLKIININEGTLITLQIVTDLSYAWNIIDKFTPVMQNGIKNDPNLVIKLRSAFLKLASALDLPLLRINQSNSSDLISVSQYYSGELVKYVRKVLQVIPKTMFVMLAKIIKLQTDKIKEVPTRLDKDKMRDYSQLSERYEVAKCTHSISILAEGMLMMKSTLVGIIKIESKHLLEDGIRKELVTRVASALHESLVFNPRGKTNELMFKLDEVGVIMDGYRRSFEYIQDYVSIYGLKIWQGEISRIINYNVEQECNSFLRNKVLDWQSIYQSQTVPIPCFPPIDSSVNFVGRLTQEILKITDPKSTVYLDYMHSWYDAKSKSEVVTIKLFEKLEKSVGTWGLTGVDKLLGFMIVQSLQNVVSLCNKKILSDKTITEMIAKIEDPHNNDNNTVQRIVNQLHNKLAKFSNQFLDIILKVGQMQLLRKSISHQLMLLCKCDSKFFSSSMNNFNNSLMADIERHYYDLGYSMPTETNPILYETSAYLDLAGPNDPLRKIYISTHEFPHFTTLNFLFITHVLQKLTMIKSLNALLPRKPSDNIDGTSFIIGIVTVFKQYHHGNSLQLISLLARYSSNFQSSTLPDVTLPYFMEQFATYSHLQEKVSEFQMPSIVSDL